MITRNLSLAQRNNNNSIEITWTNTNPIWRWYNIILSNVKWAEENAHTHTHTFHQPQYGTSYALLDILCPKHIEYTIEMQTSSGTNSSNERKSEKTIHTELVKCELSNEANNVAWNLIVLLYD